MQSFFLLSVFAPYRFAVFWLSTNRVRLCFGASKVTSDKRQQLTRSLYIGNAVVAAPA